MGLSGIIQSGLNEERKTTDKQEVCLGVRGGCSAFLVRPLTEGSGHVTGGHLMNSATTWLHSVPPPQLSPSREQFPGKAQQQTSLEFDMEKNREGPLDLRQGT